jgi:hypothetical protein
LYIDWFDLSYVPVSRDANIVINCFMENREQQILSEIKAMMASVRSQLERLDAKMAELQQIVDPEEFEAESIDIELDVDEVVDTDQTVEVQEIPLQMEDDDLPFAESEAADEAAEVHVEESDEYAGQAEEPVEPVEHVTDEPAEEDDDLPGVFDLPEPVTVESKAAEQAKPVLDDVIMADYAWRKDMPGSSVKDIRSAIGLNDRVRFINHLFNEDAQAFVNTLSEINRMESMEEVVGYVCERHPEWEMGSELVYRFMMAVRRKIR